VTAPPKPPNKEPSPPPAPPYAPSGGNEALETNS